MLVIVNFNCGKPYPTNFRRKFCEWYPRFNFFGLRLQYKKTNKNKISHDNENINKGKLYV
jgi:hypothetical protein